MAQSRHLHSCHKHNGSIPSPNPYCVVEVTCSSYVPPFKNNDVEQFLRTLGEVSVGKDNPLDVTISASTAGAIMTHKDSKNQQTALVHIYFSQHFKGLQDDVECVKTRIAEAVGKMLQSKCENSDDVPDLALLLYYCS